MCSQSTPEGALFPVDPNLRPEGRSGPLVRTLASHRAYYQRWAQTWEFQALLKARPVAGDAALGGAYAAAMRPLVWQAAQRENFVSDVQAMRRRVIGTLPAAAAGRELKLGPGGLRDIEFAVQLLQLVHGRLDESLREPATLPALAVLAAGGYVGRQDAAELAGAYRFLRRVEHLLQLRHLRRTHTMPEEPEVLRRIGRALRLSDAGQAAQSGGAVRRAGRAGGGPGRDGRRGHGPRRGAWTRPRNCSPGGASMRARSSGCTRSCSTGRCSTRWPACPARRPGSPRRRPRPGSRRSVTPTRPARCGTSGR